MIDKVQKIKEWISKEQEGLMDAQGNFEYPEHEGAYHILCNLDAYINSLQEESVSSVWHTMDEEPPQDSNICLLWPRDNIITIGKLNGLKDFRSVSKWAYAESILNLKEEPVSKDFEEALAQEWKGYNGRGAATVDALEDNTQELAFAKGFYRGAKWGKNQAKVEIQAQSIALSHGCPKEPVSKDLEAEIEYLSKRYPEVSFAKLSRIAVHVSEWQKKQMIEKVCEWVNEHKEEVVTEDNGIAGWISNEFIEELRKYLEECL